METVSSTVHQLGNTIGLAGFLMLGALLAFASVALWDWYWSRNRSAFYRAARASGGAVVVRDMAGRAAVVRLVGVVQSGFLVVGPGGTYRALPFFVPTGAVLRVASHNEAEELEAERAALELIDAAKAPAVTREVVNVEAL